MLKCCFFLKLREHSEIVILDSSSFASSICFCTGSIYRLLKAFMAIAAKWSESYPSPGMFEHFAVEMALVKWLDLALSNALLSDMGNYIGNINVHKVRMFTVIDIKYLACLAKKTCSGFTKTYESTCLCFVFLYCCLAWHIFACLTVYCSSGKVSQIVGCFLCSDFWLVVNDKSWHYSWSNCFHCENINMSFRQPTQRDTTLWSRTLRRDF